MHTLAGVPACAVGRDELVAVGLEAATPALAWLAQLVEGASAVFPLATGAEDLLTWIVLPTHLKAQRRTARFRDFAFAGVRLAAGRIQSVAETLTAHLYTLPLVAEGKI